MSDQNPYVQLGVSEDASFDEIQDVRNRLLEQYSGDAKRLEIIEASYDAILMERLRMRQEGKIKVPERIRFPEKSLQPPPKETPSKNEQSPAWLSRMLDKPSGSEVLLPGIWYTGLSAISLFFQGASNSILQLALVVGVGCCVYFINRKEGKFGRAVLFTLLGLTIGLIAGGVIGSFLAPIIRLQSFSFSAEQFSTVVTFILLWLISSFIK